MFLKPLFIAALATAIAFPVEGQGTTQRHSRQCADGELASCSLLGLIYETGVAGIMDLDRAQALYKRACEGNIEAACRRIRMTRGVTSGTTARDDNDRIGHIADSRDGAPVPYAIVDVVNSELRIISDEAGEVNLGQIQPGLHEIIVRALGYETTRGTLPSPWSEDFLVLLDSKGEEDQLAVGSIFGQITLAGSSIGLPDVAVTLVGSPEVSVVTNQQGRFSLPDLEPGASAIEFSRLGYETRRTTVEVLPEQTIEVYASMAEEAVELNPIEVSVGSGYLDRSGFYLRARNARGEVFTRRDVIERDPVIISDLLWRSPGLRVQTGRTGSEILSRRPLVSGPEGTCRLRPYLDGTPMFDWDLDLVRPDDLQALEVYQGAATPIEYRQPTDPDGTPACGVVLIWTRRNN